MKMDRVATNLAVCVLLTLGTAYPCMSANEPSGNVTYHQDWVIAKGTAQAVKLDGGPIDWSEEFSDNSAYAFCKSEERDASGGKDSWKPLQTLELESEKITSVKCRENSSGCSVWLPFGSYGFNRIRHDFKKPYPQSGALDSFIWSDSTANMRQRGVMLVLETPEGKDATISFGMWAGTNSPSYRIEGIRVGTEGYDDSIYHRLAEIIISKKTPAPSAWNDFVIDIGKTQPGKLIFGYRNSLTAPKKWQMMAKPLELIQGKDYTCIKSIVIGSLPGSNFRGKDETGDSNVFVSDVWFTTPPTSANRTK